MQVRNIVGSGRGVVATRDLSAGDVILREEAYVLVPLLSNRSTLSTCIGCLKQFFSAEPHPRCDVCGEHYCSEACKEGYGTTRHVTHGECKTMELCRGLVTELSHDDFNHMRAMVAVAIRAKLEGVDESLDEPARRVKPKVVPEVEVVCAKYAEKPEDMLFGLQNSEAESPEGVATDSESLSHEPTFASIARLTANISRFDDDQLDLYRRLAEVYTALQEEFDDDLPVVSESMFVKMSCAYQCNGFSLWNEKDKEVASGMFGYAAMVNHNCSPNIKKSFDGRTLLFVTLKPIKAGEQLFLSYVDTKLAFNLRQWRLSTQYFFECCCARCEKEKR